ncbi:T9SS type A sorting domain-containing protein, partial [Schleiferiaceae bacterium]|nr:T9SS type A sorting domain-containing protein [Schleiferiaceae bacterium]
NGYTSSIIKFTVENAGKLVFRFRFGSDYTIDNQGWAVDDFCLEEAPFGTPADIVGIGVPEVEIPGFFLGHVSPNPLSGQGAFMFNSDKPVTVHYTITNSLGQILSDASVKGEEGYNRVDLDASAWAGGLYMMEVTVDGQSLTRKFIVQH